jgi:nucleotide-binding universal stress UspA family protein
VAQGAPAPHVRERLPWFDLVVLRVVEPGRGAPRVSSAHAPVLRDASRPILAVAGAATPLARAVVAFDGTSTAHEALFAGAYLAAKWGTHMTVVTVAEGAPAPYGVQDEARGYLERFGVAAEYVSASGPVAEALVGVADERDCDLIVMGRSRYARVVDSLVGGVLVRTLLAAARPVLIV